MKKTFIIFALLGIGLPGCLVMSNKCEVVRKDEQKNPVQFESEEAAKLFKEEMNKQVCRGQWEQSEQLVVPFIIASNHKKTISYNARYNDEVKSCDLNGDGNISLYEANIYSGIEILSCSN